MTETLPPADPGLDFNPLTRGTDQFDVAPATLPEPTRTPSIKQMLRDRRAIRRGEVQAAERPTLEPLETVAPTPSAEPIEGDPRIIPDAPQPEIQAQEGIPDAPAQEDAAFLAQANEHIARAEEIVRQLDYGQFRDLYNALAKSDPAAAQELMLGKQREAARFEAQSQLLADIRRNHVGYLATQLIGQSIARHPALMDVADGQGLLAYRQFAAQYVKSDPLVEHVFNSGDRAAFEALQDRLAGAFQQHRVSLGYVPSPLQSLPPQTQAQQGYSLHHTTPGQPFAFQPQAGPLAYADSGSTISAGSLPPAADKPASPQRLSDAIQARRAARRAAAGNRPGRTA